MARKKVTTKKAAVVKKPAEKQEMKQVHGRENELTSLEDLFPVFKNKSTIKAKTATEYRTELEKMGVSDLQDHAIKEHKIVPWDVSNLQGKNRMINLCVKEWEKKHGKSQVGNRKKPLSNNAQRVAAQIFKNFGF